MDSRDLVMKRNPILFAILAWAIVAYGLGERTFLSSIDWILYDVRTSLLSAPRAPHPDIVIVALDDATLEKLPYEVPLERTFLGDLLVAIDKGKPAVVGLDVILDRPTTEDADRALTQALAAIDTPIIAVTPAVGGEVDRPPLETGQNTPGQNLFGMPVASPKLELAGGVVRYTSFAKDHGLNPFPVELARKVNPAIETGADTDGALLSFGLTRDKSWPFVTMPAHQLLSLSASEHGVAWLRDKIVLIGKVTRYDDRHMTPLRFAPKSGDLMAGHGTPGVVVHAFALAQLMGGEGVLTLPAFWRGVLGLLAAAGGAALASRIISVPILVPVIAAAVLIYLLLSFVLFAGAGLVLPVATPVIAFVGAAFILGLYGRGRAQRRAQWLRRSFALFLAPPVVERLLDREESPSLSGETREITVLFTDLEGFTSFVDTHDPAQVTEILNEYFETVINLIFKHEGTIDKIVGDALHAFFNAPLDQPDHTARAVACALDIKRETEAFRVRLQDRVASFGRTRIGVHTGPAIVGNFGGTRRFDYTAHGTTVNLASRLEQANKELGSQICVSASVRESAPGFNYEDLGTIKVRSIERPLQVYEPHREEAAGPTA